MIDKELVYKVIHDYKNEILDTGDWWYAVDGYDLNVHCPDDWENPLALYHINLYELDEEGLSSYHSEKQYDLPQMTRREIRLL
jgi:hypothetical protein